MTDRHIHTPRSKEGEGRDRDRQQRKRKKGREKFKDRAEKQTHVGWEEKENRKVRGETEGKEGVVV